VELNVDDVVAALVADFRQRCPRVDVRVEVPRRPPGDIRPDVRETVYFVLREALHNIAAHARAGTVRIALSADRESLTLVVADDGRGFEAAGLPQRSHGVVGMRERAELAGGTLDVRGTPGQGTTVTLRIPNPTADVPGTGRRFGRDPRGAAR
jgi:signal transduction histidine kinase